MCSRRSLFLNVTWIRRNNSRRAIDLAHADRRSTVTLHAGLADAALMTDALDVEQTSVGCKADLAQLRKILDAAADTKVACVVDGRLGSQCLQQLVILLDTRLLVVDMQRRYDAVGDDAGTEPSADCAAALGSTSELSCRHLLT